MQLPPPSNQRPSPGTSVHGVGRWLWPATLVALLIGTGSIFLANRLPLAQAAVMGPTEAPARVMQLHPIELTTVQRRHLEEVVKVTGTIQPRREATLSAQVGGIAETVSVHTGDFVEAGHLLVSVGTTDLQLHLDQQRSALASTVVKLRAAQATLERTEALAEKGLAAQSALEAAQLAADDLVAEIASQENEVALADANLNRASIRAPFSGIVSARTVEPGQVVSPGTALLTLVDLSTVRVEMVASLKDATQIREGQAVRLAVMGKPMPSITGTVDRVSPVAEAGTRSFKIYLNLANPDGLLRGGMFVTGEIVVREDNAVLAVPVTAVRHRDGASYVLVVEDDRVTERRVEASAEWQTGSLVEIRSGLSAGDVIVNAALAGLVDGTPVTVAGF